MILENKTIWIIGASSGIGRELAIQLSTRNNNLIISARDIPNLEKTRNSCLNQDKIVLLDLDLSINDSLNSKCNIALDSFNKKIDVVIFNSGVSQRALTINTNRELERQIFETNYFGITEITRNILPHFINNKTGVFAVTSSLVGLFGTPLRSYYSSSKHALHGFFETIRAEHTQDNIQVTIICPGFIQTNISLNALNNEGKRNNEMDSNQANGMSVKKLTEKYILSIEKNRKQKLIGGKEIYIYTLKKYFPNKFYKIISSFGKK